MTCAVCDTCLRRTWLLGELVDHVERSHERFGQPDSLLCLDDDELLAAIAGSRRERLAAAAREHDPGAARARLAAAGLQAVCRHDPGYPPPLLALPDAPAVLHVAGPLPARHGESPAAAVVGARRATPYGLEVARALGRGLAAAGVTVVSGMALGIDSAAHAGALEAGGPTVAVLAGGADVPYPASERPLYRRLRDQGGLAAELPPGLRPRRWCFPARNRLIAALAGVTVVVEAAERSGALITARVARDLGRDVAAVPGPVTSARSRGANDLIFDGAHLVRGAEDVLDLLLGVGSRPAPEPAKALAPRLRRLLDEVAGGRDNVSALAGSPEEAQDVLVCLAELELLGRVRRGAAGRYVVVP